MHLIANVTLCMQPVIREISSAVTSCRHLSKAPFESQEIFFFSNASPERSEVLLAEDLWPFHLIRAQCWQLSPG